MAHIWQLNSGMSPLLEFFLPVVPELGVRAGSGEGGSSPSALRLTSSHELGEGGIRAGRARRRPSLRLPAPARVSSRVPELEAGPELPEPGPAPREAGVRFSVGPVPGRELAGSSKWATRELGLSVHRLGIPAGTWLSGLELRSAGDRGIVDLRLLYRGRGGGGGATAWAIGVEGGTLHAARCEGRPYAMGVSARYERRAGLVNLRVLRAGGSRGVWAVPAVEGELHLAGLGAGAKMTGVEVRAAPGYGLVNIRALTR